jgi:hypothetical protein
MVLACAVTRANWPEGEGLDSMKTDLTRILSRSIDELHVDALTSAQNTRSLDALRRRISARVVTSNVHQRSRASA